MRLAFSVEEAVAHAKEMLGNTLVTAQTGDAGKQVNRLYIEDGADIDRELYCSLLVDRAYGRIAFVVSTEGGMDIETVAHDTPEKIQNIVIDPSAGVTDADVEAYLRHSIEGAKGVARERGDEIRLASVDGRPTARADDLRCDRINIDIDASQVVNAVRS